MSFVHQRNTESGSLVRLNAGLLVCIDGHLRFVNPLCFVVQYRTLVVELRFLFCLVWTISTSCYGIEYVRAIVEIIVIGFAYILTNKLCTRVPYTVVWRAINGNGDVAVTICSKSETTRLLDRLLLCRIHIVIIGEDRIVV